MKSNKQIELDLEQLSSLQQSLSSGRLEKGDNEILSGVISTVIFMSKLLRAKNTSIKRLRKMLFGDKTEKSSKVLGKPDKDDAESEKDNDQDPDGTNGSGTEKKWTKKPVDAKDTGVLALMHIPGRKEKRFLTRACATNIAVHYVQRESYTGKMIRVSLFVLAVGRLSRPRFMKVKNCAAICAEKSLPLKYRRKQGRKNLTKLQTRQLLY